ncbi:MAG: cell wall hydrolase [Defluviitaleaceae bacterium]|nr:cell wall hydrolase [Defluviitaleaceae bacterium]
MTEIFQVLIAIAFSTFVANQPYDAERPLLRLSVNNFPIHEARILRNEEETFVPIRAVTEKLGAEVFWQPEKTMIIYKKDEYFPNTFLWNGISYTNITEIENIFGLNFDYHYDLNILSIGYFDETIVRSFATFDNYTEEDLAWLSRIIHAEARGESFEGMLAVGSVVMNRIVYPAYPNTIKEVIFDRKNGVQFSPVIDGSINNSPHPMAILAAIEVLEGRRNAGYALFFKNPNIVPVSWISNNRQYAFSIENHSFFN